MKEPYYTDLPYEKLSEEEIILIRPLGRYLKKVKKDKNGYYVNGNHWFDPDRKMYLKDFENKKENKKNGKTK